MICFNWNLLGLQQLVGVQEDAGFASIVVAYYDD
jgi:hypothetical protein